MAEIEPSELARKYIRNVEYALIQLRSNEQRLDEKVDEVVRLAECYLEDAKRFLVEGEVQTSLIAISYSEGLLDALRILNLAKFSWPKDR
ncbi:hypothetical protein DRO48_03045 [Candidatus Bathyarchaeota archaeon]|nr:MAG: hypothetical protein DRO48_03045 [Candidatus Bathyarchaeota archaeon]